MNIEPACPKCGSTNITPGGGVAGSGRIRWRCKACKHRTTNPYQNAEITFEHPTVPEASSYVITAAQNATPAFKGFLKSLLNYCDHRGAQLLVVPTRYRNPTSVWAEKDQSDQYWDDAVVPYLCNARESLVDGLMLLGDVNVQPTAPRPLTGFDTLTGGASGIIAHPKIELKCIATTAGELPKIMTTTGAVTQQNYTHSGAGKKGEFHHAMGACVVDIEDGRFHIRQLNATKDGSFYDLNKKYSGNEVKKIERIEALFLGDTHTDFVDQQVVEATFSGVDSIVGVLKPKYLCWNDLFDAYARSHWHQNDPFRSLAKYDGHKDDVEGEMRRAFDFVKTHTPPDTMNIIVPSNHNHALTKWVRETDWRKDPANAAFYLKTALAMVEGTKLDSTGTYVPDAWVHWAHQYLPEARVLVQDESFQIKGVELGMHGHAGPNGARGSLANLSKVGVKSFLGHSHSPGIQDGSVQVGTMSVLKRDYMTGPSNWMHSHGILYPNGKRALINIIDGQTGIRHG